MAWSDEIVAFAEALRQQRARQAEELSPGGGDDVASPLVREWLLLAAAAEGALERTPANRAAVRMACVSMGEVLFGLPRRRFHDPQAPDWWEEHPIGRVWWLARVWAEDDLITIRQAADRAKVSVQAVSQRRDLPFFANVGVVSRGRVKQSRLVRRADVDRLEWDSRGTGPRLDRETLDTE